MILIQLYLQDESVTRGDSLVNIHKIKSIFFSYEGSDDEGERQY